MEHRPELKLTLPNHLEYLPIALAFVREAGGLFGFAGSALNQIEVAAEEAVTNVMKHAFDREENLEFQLICRRRPDGLEVVVKETGIPFDPSLIPQYDPSQASLDAPGAGVGTFLMKAMMDECSFVNLGLEGKETRLVKYFKDKPAEVITLASMVESAEPEVIKEKIEFDVRLMEEREAIEVSRCAFKSHGYSFFDEHIYFPERLAELNRTGEMISAVAVTRDGVFMGHCAFLFQDPQDRIAELTFAFVNVEYRGQGALNRLTEFLFAAPSRKPLDGVYAYAVANHVFTQKAMARYQIKDCGLLLATSPASWKFKGIPGDPNQRISVILAFRYLGAPKPLTLFLPPQHRDMIVKLYRHIGAEHHCPDHIPAPELPPDGAILKPAVNEAEQCAEMYVERYDAGTVLAVRKWLRRCCLDKMAAINLFLSLEEPATAHLTAEFEKLGFFFAGILPGTRAGDTLMLQYLNNVDLDYSKISAYSDMAQELLAYMRERDPNAGL